MEIGLSIVKVWSPDFKPDYDCFIFHTPVHLKLQTADWNNFYLVKKANKNVLAQVSFHVEKRKSMTPFRAPFGSFLFSEKLSPQGLYDFIQHCEQQLRSSGVKQIFITEPPLFYRSKGELLQSILINLGYRVKQAEISSGIGIDVIPFDRKIDAWEKRKLKQTKTKGGVCKQLPLSALDWVYEFILQCRKQKSQSLSMTLEEIQNTANAFKKEFLLFGVYFGNELAAASIAIKVSPSILYNFYSAHLKKFDSMSPVVMLINGMYGYGQAHDIQLLDLGTSSADGQPNFSLLDFKLRMGAVPSMKLTFEKNLE